MNHQYQILKRLLDLTESNGFIRFGDWIYRNCYSLYVPIYSLYKMYTDRFVVKLIKNVISEGSMVLDVGANNGFFSKLFAVLVGTRGSVHSFEPEDLNFKRLKKRLKTRKNVSVYKLAIADKSGKMKLYKSNINVDHRTYDDKSGKKIIEIKAISIDDWFKKEKVDFIKMDIQGFEYNALLGMAETLKNNPDLILLLECWPYGLRKAGASVPAMLKYLNSMGFHTWKIDSKNHKLVYILPAQINWDYCELQPSVYFNIWCKRPIT